MASRTDRSFDDIDDEDDELDDFEGDDDDLDESDADEDELECEDYYAELDSENHLAVLCANELRASLTDLAEDERPLALQMLAFFEREGAKRI